MFTNELKNLLLGLDLVLDNEYLNQYCELILNNKGTEKQKYKTQRHHVIPVAYYKNLYGYKRRKEAETYANTDESNFLINLSYKDHLLAHYYLGLCGKEDWFKFSNINVITFNTNRFTEEFDLDIIIKNLDHYQELYEFSCRYKSENMKKQHTALSRKRKEMHQNRTTEKKNEVANKISKALKSYHESHTPTEEEKARRAEGRKKSAQAVRGSRRSLETKQKMSQVRRSKQLVNIFRETQNKSVPSIELDDYLKDGWNKGLYSKKTLAITDGETDLRIDPNNFNEYEVKGFYKGHSHKTSQKLRTLEYKTIHKDNEEKRVPKKDLDRYLLEGWDLGKATSTSKYANKNIYQLNSEKIIINEFKDALDVCNQLCFRKGATSYIYDACRDFKKTYKSYHWCFTEDYERIKDDISRSLNGK